MKKISDGQTVLAVQEDAAVSQSQSILELISTASRDSSIDVGKLERLLVMYEKVMADNRMAAYMAAMSRLQAKLPQIRKDGRIVVKGTERSRYARIEDIDVAIRPLLAEEGFAFSFDTDSSDAKLFKISCKLSHRDGYSETKFLTLPLDSSDYRSNVQSIGSTVSYGKRQLIKMHLNLVEKGEDDDGSGGDQKISEEQIKVIGDLIIEIKANASKFLKFMGVAGIPQILSRDYQKAINALQVKVSQSSGQSSASGAGNPSPVPSKDSPSRPELDQGTASEGAGAVPQAALTFLQQMKAYRLQNENAYFKAIGMSGFSSAMEVGIDYQAKVLAAIRAAIEEIAATTKK